MAALTKRQAPGWRRKQNDLTQTSELRTAPTQTTLLITRMAKLGGGTGQTRTYSASGDSLSTTPTAHTDDSI